MGGILADHRVSMNDVFKGEEDRGVKGACSAGEQHLADRGEEAQSFMWRWPDSQHCPPPP